MVVNAVKRAKRVDAQIVTHTCQVSTWAVQQYMSAVKRRQRGTRTCALIVGAFVATTRWTVGVKLIDFSPRSSATFSEASRGLKDEFSP